MTQVPVGEPWLDAADLALMPQVIASGWVTQGPMTVDFERAFAQRIDAGAAAACSSGTAALHLALAALDVGPGDEVIVPAFSWIATANAVAYVGATARFVDVDPHTFNLDPHAVDDAVTSRTVGILPVHLFGLPADLDAIGATAKRFGLWVVEDAACGFGAYWRGQHVGTFGRFGCFSFHPRKAITTGEGGMVVAADESAIARVRRLRSHGLDGIDPSDPCSMGDAVELGFNYRLSDVQSALGLAQLARGNALLDARRTIAAWYDDALASLPVALPARDERAVHAWQAYVVRVPAANDRELADAGERRDCILRTLRAAGIGARPGTMAITRTRYWREQHGVVPEAFPEAAAAERTSIALPMGPRVDREVVGRVAAILHDVLLRGKSPALAAA